MLRSTVTAIILIPLAVILIGLAVANRQVVTISFDPFDASHPAYSVTLPLFVVILVLVILGVLIGGTAAWMRQSRWRAAARRAEARTRQLNGEVAMLRRQLETTERPEPPARVDPAPRLPLRSPVN
jgi:uncharacterized integral membrane protein